MFVPLVITHAPSSGNSSWVFLWGSYHSPISRSCPSGWQEVGLLGQLGQPDPTRGLDLEQMRPEAGAPGGCCPAHRSQPFLSVFLSASASSSLQKLVRILPVNPVPHFFFSAEVDFAAAKEP